METVDMNDSANSNGQEASTSADIPFPDEPRQDEHDVKGGEIPLPPETSDSVKYSPSQVEEGSPSEESSPKKPVLPPDLARKRFLAMSRQKVTLAARSSAPSQSSKKPTSKGVSQYSGRANQPSQPPMLIETIMLEEKKIKERMIQTGSKLVNLPAVVSVPTTTPATAIVKPLQMSEPRPLPVEDVPLKKSELAAKESRGAERSSSGKNYRQRRSSSGSSASPAISRSISPRRRHERRSRSRDQQDSRRRDRDENRSKSYRGGRRSPGRVKDIRRRSRSPNPKEKSRRRGSRSASPDKKRRDRERHQNDRSPSFEHEKQRKIRIEEDRASDNRKSRRERSPSFVLEKNISFKTRSPRRSFEHDDSRTAKHTNDRRHRDSSSRDPRDKNTSRRDRDQELENQQKQIREEEEIRMRKEAEEKELDKIRTSRLPLDWTDYKKFEYTDQHISNLKNRMDPTRTTSSSPSSSRDPSPSERQQFFSKVLIQNPEVLKFVELNTKGKIVESIIKRTKSKMPIEYTVPKNSCAGCYTSRNIVWDKEDKQVVDEMNYLLKSPLFSSQVELKIAKGFRFLKQEQDLCPSDGSRGVNISRLYSDEESDEPVNHKETAKSEVFKLRKEDSVEADRASSPQSDEMEEDYASDSAESVPSPLLKKRYDDEEAAAVAVEIPIVPQPSPPASESPEGRNEETAAVLEKLDEKVKNKSRKEKKKRKAKDKKKRRKRDSSSSSSDDSEESEDETNITKKRSKKRKKEEKNKKDKKKKRSKKRKQKSQTPESSSSTSSSDSESSSSDSSESEKDKKKKSKKKKVKKKSRQQKRDEDSPDDEDQNKGGKPDRGGDAGSTSKRRGDGDQHEDTKGDEKRRRTSDRKHKEDRKKDSSKHRRRSLGINPDGSQFEVSSPALSTSSTGSGSGSDGSKLHDFEKLEDALTARIEADPSVVAEELLGVKQDIAALPPEKFKTDVEYDPYAGETTPSEQLHSNPIPVITRRGSGDALHRNAEAVLQMTQVDNDDVKLLFDNDLEFDADQMLDLLSGANINGDTKGGDCIDYLTEMWDRFVDGAGTTPGSKSEADSAYISDDEKFRAMIPPVPTTSSRVLSIPEPPGYRLPSVTEIPIVPSQLSPPLKSRSPSLSPRPRSPRSRSRSRSISPARRRSRPRYEEDRRYRGRDSEFYDSRHRDRDRDRSYRPRRPYRDDDGYGSGRSRDRDRDYYYDDERRFRERTKRENGRYDDRQLLDKGRYEYDVNIDKRVNYNVSHQLRSPLEEPPVYLPPAGYAPPQMTYAAPCCLPPPGFDPTVPPPLYPAMAPSGPLDHQIVSLQLLPEQSLRETTAFELPFMVGELEGNHRNPSNLREIVPAVSFSEGNRSPKRLSLDERLEVEMGIKITRDDSSNMPLVGGFAGLRNVPQVPTPNPALLQTMQQASAQPFHQEPANQLQGCETDLVQEKGPAEHSTAIKRGNLIKVVPMVPIERSFTITKANCKWNPIVVQQTAEQVIRKEGDDVPPKRCVTVNVPTVPFEIPLIAPDDSSVAEHPEDLIQRLKDERRQARKKKLEIKRKRQLRKRIERRKLIKNIPTDDEELEMETSSFVEDREETENPSSGPNEGYIAENDTELLKTENIENLSDDKMDESTKSPPSVIENGTVDADEPNGEAEEDVDDSSPRPAFEPLSPQQVAVPDPSAEPAKSILAIVGLRRRKEESKGVRFVDGVAPGYGSSRSEGEEEVVSPTPGTRAKSLGKKKERRKKVRSAVEEERRKKLKLLEDAELIENQEPPPPPSAPYPYCPLGILYQFNPPYAVLYAQAVVEHGFELTFKPSIFEPKAVFYDWPTESSAASTEP